MRKPRPQENQLPTAPATPRLLTRRDSPAPPKLHLIHITIAIVAVGVVVTAVHWPVLSAQALSIDDNQYLTRNPLVQRPGWPSVERFFGEVLEPSTVRGYYQPLTMISLMIDYAGGGRPDNLAAFHHTSLSLHVANTALIVVLLYLLFGRLWVAALVGLLFGVHPLTVEPLAWIAERKTVLATFFALLSLVLYAGYARRRNLWLMGGALAAFALALLSKPTTTPLPVLLLLLDYWPLRRLSWRAVLEKLPFFVLAGVAAAITIISQGRTAQITAPTDYSPVRIGLILCHNIVFYLYKIVWPLAVSGHYAFPRPLVWSQPMVLAGVVGTCVLLPVLLASWRWTRGPLVGWLFFFAAILPTMGVIGFTNVIAADKFAYLPALGLLLVLAYGLAKLWGAGADAQCRLRRVVLAFAVLSLAALEAWGTRAHLAHWHDSASLYRHMLEIDPHDEVPHYNLGLILAKRGDEGEAEEHFAAAVASAPRLYKAHRELGVLREKRGDLAGALACYRRAVEIDPHFASARISLGLLLVRQGQLDGGRQQYEAVLARNPDHAIAHYNLGLVLYQQSRWEDAAAHFEHAIRSRRDFARAYHGLGLTRLQQRRYDDAVDAFRAALRINPHDDQARAMLNSALRARNGPGG